MFKFEKLTYINERDESVEFSTRSIFHSNEINGLSGVKNSIYSFNSISQDGDSYLGSRIESREIEIIGNVNTVKKDEIIEARRLLCHILSPHLKGILKYECGDFVKVIDCNIENAPIFKSKGGVFQEFAVQLLCCSPFWKDVNETKVDIASWIGSLEFELEIPQSAGMQIGYREPRFFVDVFNNGDVVCGMRIEIRANGTANSPQILNVKTGELIKFNNMELVAGDVLVISTFYGQKSIKIHNEYGTIDAFKFLDIDSTYLQLEVGDNIFKYEAFSNAENLEVSIFHNNNYLGV